MLNEDFVCATINTEGDPTAGASVGHAPTDSCGSSFRGIGRQNVQCLFLTPKGEIFHVASGFRGADDLESVAGVAVHEAIVGLDVEGDRGGGRGDHGAVVEHLALPSIEDPPLNHPLCARRQLEAYEARRF